MTGRPRLLAVVFGTGTEVGKTWVTCRVLEAAQGAGIAARARKPVQSFDPPPADRQGPGEAQWAPGASWGTDAELLAAAAGETPFEVCPANRWYPLAVAPPMAADRLGRPPIAVADLADQLEWPHGTEVGLVETVGGPRSPIGHDGDSVDLADLVRPDLAVLVADAGLGTINAVRVTAAAIARWRLVVVLNRFDAGDPLHAANLAWLRDVDGFEVATDPAAALRP